MNETIKKIDSENVSIEEKKTETTKQTFSYDQVCSQVKFLEGKLAFWKKRKAKIKKLLNK